MKKRLLVWLLLLTSLTYCKTPIVFVHLGRMVPTYYKLAIEHAKAFNEDTPIYLVIHARALPQLKRKKMIPQGTNIVIAQQLTPSEKHKQFLQLIHQKTFGSMLKFWQYSMERFFIIEEFMEQSGIEEVLHLEGDNLIYCELDPLVEKLRKAYRGIAVPFLNDEECVPGIVYVKKRKALRAFTQFINDNLIGEGHRSDMTLLSMSGISECLPSVPPLYAATEEMVSLNGKTSARFPLMYAHKADELGVLFDPAPIGQLLDGESYLQTPRRASIVNQQCVYDARSLPLSWKKDSKGRIVPYLFYKGKYWPLVNLHIHSKNLHKFARVKS